MFQALNPLRHEVTHHRSDHDSVGDSCNEDYVAGIECLQTVAESPSGWVGRRPQFKLKVRVTRRRLKN